MDKLLIVVPCYNEEEVLPETIKQLSKLLLNMINRKEISDESKIIFVDDGSKDKTWIIIEENANSFIGGIKLAGNVGHQNALYAGLMAACDIGDMAISIDADLQDDIWVIPEMVQKYKQGNDIVYGVRKDRKEDSWFKRTSAQIFYRIMNMLGTKTIYNHADFRLMSKRALNELKKYKERNLFLRGIVPLIGYKTDCVYYVRKSRWAGESKYPLKKMVSLAFDGITSFSTKMISIITILGFLIIICSVIAIIYTLISYVTGNTVPGWASIMLSIWMLSGVQLISIGLIGQYVGKIYVEVKKRPRYNVEAEIGLNRDENL